MEGVQINDSRKPHDATTRIGAPNPEWRCVTSHTPHARSAPQTIRILNMITAYPTDAAPHDADGATTRPRRVLTVGVSCEAWKPRKAMAANQIEWFEFPNQPGKDVPQWHRTSGITADGTVFVPSVVTGVGEPEVMLCVAYDSTPSVRHLGHLYVPAEWVSREFPAQEHVCSHISDKVRKASGSTGAHVR